MSKFQLEVAGLKKFAKYGMPDANDVGKKLKGLWEIRWDKEPNWSPIGQFKFRERDNSDPVFRLKDFKRGREDELGGLDLLGRYRRHDSLVTVYIDSCFKAARRFDRSGLAQ